jgi:hypothetical protein
MSDPTSLQARDAFVPIPPTWIPGLARYRRRVARLRQCAIASQSSFEYTGFAKGRSDALNPQTRAAVDQALGYYRQVADYAGREGSFLWARKRLERSVKRRDTPAARQVEAMLGEVLAMFHEALEVGDVPWSVMRGDGSSELVAPKLSLDLLQYGRVIHDDREAEFEAAGGLRSVPMAQHVTSAMTVTLILFRWLDLLVADVLESPELVGQAACAQTR